MLNGHVRNHCEGTQLLRGITFPVPGLLSYAGTARFPDEYRRCVDDAVALIMALRAFEVQVVAIWTGRQA